MIMCHFKPEIFYYPFHSAFSLETPHKDKLLSPEFDHLDFSQAWWYMSVFTVQSFDVIIVFV